VSDTVPKGAGEYRVLGMAGHENAGAAMLHADGPQDLKALHIRQVFIAQIFGHQAR
jgi:hypothetical protein